MSPDYRPTFIDRAVCAVAPVAGMRRLAAQRVLHQYRYEGAEMGHKRKSATQNMSPNAFDVQRDRLQLMREAEDLERNFAPAMMLNRKYAMYASPVSYHAQTGDKGLDTEVEEYLNGEAFPNCDHTGRYNFFRMMEFAVMGCNRGGDYGFAFTRPGLTDDMDPDEAAMLDLKIQAIEPDRIGGVYQNVVSNDYVAGLLIGDRGQVTAYRVFHRSMTTNCYDNPVDIPADQFVHITDPLRIDMYRGVSKLATAVQNLRDLYEMVDFVKGKAKIASALTVFTNSNGAMQGGGGMDAYSSLLPGQGGSVLQQDIQFGQINHLAGGTDIKFPSSNSPSSEEQALMTLLLKFVAMSYNLPYSFALDASELGGVSSRLESEMAKAEFERGQQVFAPHASRIKDIYLLDAVGKGIFPPSTISKLTRGRWGYRQHPQPDIGREASASVMLYEHGMLDPIQHWINNGGDPEGVANNMVRWAAIKRDAAAAAGMDVVEVFGNGPSKPLSITVSTTESTTNDPKQFARHDYGRHDTQISQITASNQKLHERIAEIRGKLADLEKKGPDFSPSLAVRLRQEMDSINNQIDQNRKTRQRLRNSNSDGPAKPQESPEQKEKKTRLRDDRHALIQALIASGREESQAYAIAYHVTENGDFNKSRLPSDIQEKYYP